MKVIRGSDLRGLRRFSKVTVTSVAEAVGVKTRKTIMNWEKGIGTPGVNQFFDTLRICNIDVDRYFQRMFEVCPNEDMNLQALTCRKEGEK